MTPPSTRFPSPSCPNLSTEISSARDQACFGCSTDHPFGFHLKFERDGDDVVTRMTPGDRYQGAPGSCTEVLVATLADELAAWACIAITGKFGVTASFDARYLQPARIGKEIEGRAYIVQAAGRFIDIEVSCSRTATLLYLCAQILAAGQSRAWRRC